jgi:hypothetical protein
MTETELTELDMDLLREFTRIRQIELDPPPDNIPALPDEPDAASYSRRIVGLDASSLLPLPEAQSKDAVRSELPRIMHEYADHKGAREILLVSAPAGIGKSYSGVQFVQERAQMGERWYWAAQNHAMYEDLNCQPNFDSSQWYHWSPMDGEIDGVPACKYPAAQRRWTEKGYRARNLCWWLCGRVSAASADEDEAEGGSHMSVCPFRTQGARQKPVTFIMHQHLFTGLDDGKADGIVIDESFIGLLAREQHVPGPEIKQANIDLRVIELANLLYGLWSEIVAGQRGRTSGKALLDVIGEILPDVYVQLENMREIEELKKAAKHYRNPPVFQPEEVENLQAIYMDALVQALMPEHGAWKAGKDLWAERVWLEKDGLHFVTPAKLWDRLPRKVIILDATGRGGFYQNVFLRAVSEYRPNVERQGHIYQVAGRMYSKHMGTNGKRKEKTASDTTQQWFAVVRELIAQHEYKNIAVITQLNVEKIVQRELGLTAADTLHYYKLRGRNDLKGRDAVFLFGTPTPAERTITNIALALNPRMIEPIYKFDEDGNHVPIYVPRQKEFRFTPAGHEQIQNYLSLPAGSAARVVGLYPDPLLASIQTQLREAEILQAVYRARLIDNPADVWIFSSIPIDEPIDGVYDDPPIAPGAIGWKLWLKMRTWYEGLPDGAEFGYEELSEAVDVTEQHLRRLDALTAIAGHYGAGIERIKKRLEQNLNKGRKREFLRKL